MTQGTSVTTINSQQAQGAQTNVQIKKKLALAYQIAAHLKLDDHTYTHLSARAVEQDQFYILPFGLRFEEITPDNLIKVSQKGDVIEGSEFQYNRTGFMIHGPIYQARPDIKAVFHVHTPEIVAVSICDQGLMPISQWALHFYDRLSYHDYDSLVEHEEQAQKLTQDLGDHFSMLLRNHGSITCGRTIEEAMFYTYHLQQASKAQCLAFGSNQMLRIPSTAMCTKAVKALLSFEKNLGERDWKAWERCLKK